MRIVMLLGPSSAGKSSVCSELSKAPFNYKILDADEILHKWQENGKFKEWEELRNLQIKQKLIDSGLLDILKPYMSETELMDFCIKGTLKVSVDNKLILSHQFKNPELQELEEILSKTDFIDLALNLRRVATIFKETDKASTLHNAHRAYFAEALSDKYSVEDTVVLDMGKLLPSSSTKTLETLADFNKQVEQYNAEHKDKPAIASLAIAYCNPVFLSERVAKRNKDATESNNPTNKRYGYCALSQLASLVKCETTPSSIKSKLGHLSQEDILQISKLHPKKLSKTEVSSDAAFAGMIENFSLPAGLEKDTKLPLALREGIKPDAFIDTSIGTPAELANQLTSQLAIKSLMQVNKIPGLSIARIKDGKITAEKTSFGLAENKTDNPVEVTDDTRFEACSLSKPVFAYLIHQLIKQGLLPKDFLTQKLPAHGKLATDPRTAELTPEILLSHQSGLTNKLPMEFTKFTYPGAQFIYSGAGFIYLQEAVEAEIQKTYPKENLETLAQKFVLQPLDMSHSSYVCPESMHIPVVHSHGKNGEYKAHKRYREFPEAHASLNTTAYDYIKFLQAILNDQEFIDNYLKPYVSIKDAEHKCSWGLGFGLQKTVDGTIAFHWGDNGDCKAFCAINLDTKDAIVYFANSANGLRITKDFVEPVVGDLHHFASWLDEFQARADYAAGVRAYQNNDNCNATRFFARILDLPEQVGDDLKRSANEYLNLLAR